MSGAERYDRQQRIPGWDQARLACATVLVAGAGALGNEALKNLALLGVGQVLIVDLDRIEPSNLSRTLLFREADLGLPKAVVAARAVQQLNPAVQVTALVGDLRFVLGLGRLHACTLALGCLDNQGARAFLSRMCLLAGVPLLDGAMGALGGEVRAFLDAAGPCFACTLTLNEQSDLWLRYSCSSGFHVDDAADPAPTTITTTAVIGGLLAQEAARLLLGQPVENGSALVYNGQTGRLHRAGLRRDPACPNHHPLDWERVVPLFGPVEAVTAAALLAHVPHAPSDAPTLELGRDLLIGFVCPNCDQPEAVEQPQGLVAAATAVCPRCGALRHPQVVSTVTGIDPWTEWTLARLGMQPGDLITVRAHEQVWLFVASWKELP
ncbi:MAG: ThiF family adenylyltransferase [Chloroflexales bacterium]|nr:ThiF family adenylyltransferase [Chloroflexales bacterium]